MKNKKILSLSVLCCSAMLLAGCGSTPSQPQGPSKTYYTVTFMNGETVFDTKEVEANDTVDKPATDPQKVDHEFIGWFTEQSEGTKWIFETDIVTQNMSLYAHFELNQIDYTVNLLLDGEVKETKTTNSKDQTEITLPAVAVSEGKSLLGWGDTAGTTKDDVDYRVGAKLTYEQIVALADTNHVVNLHAVVKTGEIIRLNVGLWNRYADAACVERVLAAFKTKADATNIEYDFLDYTSFEPAEKSGDAYFSVDDFAPAIVADTSIGVAFPVGSNFQTKAGKIGETENYYVKQNEALGVAIKNAKGETSSDTSRYVARLSDSALDVAFVTWLLSDEGKLVLNPDYSPATVTQTTITISFYGRFITEDAADAIIEALETYFTQQSLSYTKINKDYVTKAIGNNNSNYLSNMSSDADVSIGGKTNLTGFAKTPVKTVNIGAVKDGDGTSQPDRACFTFVNGNLCNACADYFATDAWTTLLAQLNA